MWETSWQLWLAQMLPQALRVLAIAALRGRILAVLSGNGPFAAEAYENGRSCTAQLISGRVACETPPRKLGNAGLRRRLEVEDSYVTQDTMHHTSSD